ncbi:hypothetical protein [Ornithinimicrobium pekingense]|uniref:Dihydroorotate dehydrogenase n=1 Tax=Ornithinimicrobium pekingense TaxID=384677 RepID=A0ABQ2F9L0_9MICO|nr:hypothetical protein [Ornithinimicrobium pekingense]GGK74246.1 hypothetical protein GCM10011509_23570 [Ornithinimicrobium pekingense]
MSARGPAPLPPVLLGVGAVSDPRALARLGDLSGIPVPVGPVEAGVRRARAPGSVVHRVGVGGLDHDDATAVSVDAARELLGWAATRGLGGCLVVRGTTTGDLAAVVEQVHRSLEGDAVMAVEVDLRGADDQTVLRCMSRVREAAPRDQRLLARVSATDPALVACARAAVAGGASAVVVSGQVRLGPRRWWSGPSTAAVCLAGLRALRVAAAEQRWPGAPLVAAGGVHGPAAALDALAEGAASVQLGSALWADPSVLWTVRDAVAAGLPRAGDDVPPTQSRTDLAQEPS